MSARLLLEKGQKIVIFSGGDHRVCTLVGLDGVLYFRDSDGGLHRLQDGETAVPNAGSLRIRFNEQSLALSFWMHHSNVPFASIIDHFSPGEQKTYKNLLQGKGAVSAPAVAGKRAAIAALVLAALAGGVAFMSSRGGCAEEASEEDAASR